MTTIYVSGCNRPVPCVREPWSLDTEGVRHVCTAPGAPLLGAQSHAHALTICGGCPLTRVSAHLTTPPPGAAQPGWAASWSAPSAPSAPTTAPVAQPALDPALMALLGIAMPVASPAPATPVIAAEAPSPPQSTAIAPEPEPQEVRGEYQSMGGTVRRGDATAGEVAPALPPQPALVPTEGTQGPSGYAPRTTGPKPAFHTLLPQDSPIGGSVFGASTLRAFRSCMRAGYYGIVRGFRRRHEVEEPGYGKEPRLDALVLGTLVHELLRLHYLTRSEEAAALLERVAANWPFMAAEADRLVTYHQEHYAEQDAARWDVRFAELECRVYLKARKVKGLPKRISICLSARPDLGVARKAADQPRLPPGEPAKEGIVLCDHKTTAQVSKESSQAYQHDPQMLQQFGCYGYGVLADGRLAAEVYGPPLALVVNTIGKAIQHDPAKHLVRPMIMFADALVREYLGSTEAWVYEELVPRLFSPGCQNENTWPKCWQCRDPSTGRGCSFLRLCEAGGIARTNPDGLYRVERPLDPQALLYPSDPPKPAKRGRKARGAAVADLEAK